MDHNLTVQSTEEVIMSLCSSTRDMLVMVSTCALHVSMHSGSTSGFSGPFKQYSRTFQTRTMPEKFRITFFRPKSFEHKLQNRKKESSVYVVSMTQGYFASELIGYNYSCLVLKRLVITSVYTLCAE